MKRPTLFPVLALIVATLLASATARAAVRHWDGGGLNAFWDVAANWSNNVAPANGDALFFPTNVARLTNSNRVTGNLTNLSTIRITGDGYRILSVPFINLTNGVTNAGFLNSANILNAGLNLRGNQTWSVSGRNSLTQNSNVVWTGFSLTNNIAGTLIMNGVFNGGTGAQLFKLGGGRLELNGTPNSIPTVRVVDGTLQVDGTLTASSLVISNGATLAGTGGIPAFTCAGDFSPGTVVTPGLLAMTGGGNATFTAGSRFLADVNGLVPGVDCDQFRTATPPNLSGATLLVSRSFSFTYRIGQTFVIITNTGVSAITTTFANLQQNGLITNNGVVFKISYSGGSGNDVELTVVDAPFAPTGVTRIWDGGGVGALFSNPANWEGDVAPQDGDSILFPTSLTAPDNLATNDMAIRFEQLQCASSGTGMTLRGNPLFLSGGIIATQSGGALTVFNRISFTGPAAIQTADGNVVLQGSVTNGGTDLTITGGAGRVEIHGVLSGEGGLVVDSIGGALLSNGNIYQGTTRLLRGTVQIGAPGSLGDNTSGPTFIGGGVVLSVAATRLFESSIVLTGRVSFGTLNTSNVLTAFEFAGSNASLLAGPAAPVQFFGPWTGSEAQLDQGDFILNSSHSVAGGITVGNRGRFFANGSGNSDITLGQAANQVGQLGGTGRAGRVTVTIGRGRVAPGNSPGVLTTSNVVFTGVTTNTFELNGLSAGINYDQLRVNGTVSLGGARLEIILGFTPAAGDKLVLIDNDGNDPINGTYADLPEDSLIAAGAHVFRITYVGGNGNDVVLTAVEGVFVPSGVTRVWDGGAAAVGGSRNWSVTANWEADLVPARGDSLVFPASAPLNTRIQFNNLPATNAVFDRIWFGGLGNTWIVQGGPLKLFGGITATNDSVFGNASFGNAGIELIGSQSWSATNMSLALNTPITLGGFSLDLACGLGGSIFLQNPIVGPGAVAMDAGPIQIFAESGFSDTAVTIQGAEVFAATGLHTGPPWQMSAGSLRLGTTEIPGLTATAGVLDLSLQSGANIAGDLTLASACTVLSRFELEGEFARPSLIAAGQVKLGGSTLTVGPVDSSLLNTPITLIEKTSGGAVAGTFAGLPEGAFIAATNEFNGLVTRYRISYVGGDGNDVTLTPVAPPPTGLTRTWTGAGTDPSWSTAPNWTGNTPPGDGDSVFFPVAAAQRSNTNPVPGLVLNRVEWSGSNYHHSGTFTLLGGLNHGAVGGTNTIAITSALATLGSQTWAVSNSASAIRVIGDNEDGSGEILGSGSLTKSGEGTLELSHLAVRTAEALVVDGGTARLIDVFFEKDSPLRLQQGRIEASDVDVQSLTMTNGHLVLQFHADPEEERSIGGLFASGDVAFTSNATVTVQWTNDARVALRASSLDLGNARLDVTFPPALPPGDSIIVAQYFENTLTGTFANLPDGTVTNYGGRSWRILYDVELPDEQSDQRFIVLVPPAAAPAFTSIEVLQSGDVILTGTAGPGAAVNIEASETPGGFDFIGATVANGTGQFTFVDNSGASVTRFYRATLTPP